eukprot:m.319038 g.319038  ORF g.319038 m.319038 type:complete len:260 (+) comp16445_c0_seq68:2170-2949(+)
MVGFGTPPIQVTGPPAHSGGVGTSPMDLEEPVAATTPPSPSPPPDTSASQGTSKRKLPRAPSSAGAGPSVLTGASKRPKSSESSVTATYNALPPLAKAAVLANRLKALSEKARRSGLFRKLVDTAEKFIGKRLDREDADGKRFQVDAFASAVLDARNQVLMLPTGSGKTEIALAIARCTRGLVTLCFPLATLRDEVHTERIIPLLGKLSPADKFSYVLLSEAIVRDRRELCLVELCLSPDSSTAAYASQIAANMSRCPW